MPETPEKSKRKGDQLSFLDTMSELSAEDKEAWTDTSKQHSLKVADSVLDKVHQSMLLFAANKNEALSRLLNEDGVGSDVRFWSLAQGFSALIQTILMKRVGLMMH